MWFCLDNGQGSQAANTQLPANIDLSLTIPEKDDTVAFAESNSVARRAESSMTTIQASTLTTPSGSLKAATPANPSITTSMSSPATARTDSSLKKTNQVASVAHEKTSGDRSKGRRKTTAAPATESTPRLHSDTCALLVRKVNALTGMAKEEEIKRLNALPDMEMRWANSDAVMESLVGSEPELPPYDPPSPSPPGAPFTTAQEDIQSQQETSRSPLVSPSVGVSSPESPGTAVLSDTVELITPPSALSDALPPWIKQHAERLLNISMLEELKNSWNSVIRNWLQIEELLDFQAPRDGFSPAGRPAAITLWVQNARRKSVIIQPDAYEQFVEAWFGWGMISVLLSTRMLLGRRCAQAV